MWGGGVVLGNFFFKSPLVHFYSFHRVVAAAPINSVNNLKKLDSEDI